MNNAFYNEKNTPQLTSAVELDILLCEFSQKLLNNQLGYKKVSLIEDEDDISEIMRLVKLEVFDKFKIEEYFSFDVNK